MIRRAGFLKRRKSPRRRSERQAAKDDALIDAKAEVVKRSGGACEARFSSHCKGAATQWHHRKPRSAGGEHTRANLLHCCFTCHHELHAYPAESYNLGLLVHSWEEPAEIAVRQPESA